MWRETGAAYAKNPDHKIIFLVNTTNKLQKSPIRFHIMHWEDLKKIFPFKVFLNDREKKSIYCTICTVTHIFM